MSWSGSKSIFAQIQSVGVGWCKKGKRKRLLTMNNFNGWQTVVPGSLKPFLSLNIIFSLVYCCFFSCFHSNFCLHGQEWLLGWSYCFDWWLTLLFFVPMPLSQWLTTWLQVRGVCTYVAMFTDLVGELIWHRCGAQKKSDVFDCGDGVLLLFFEVWCCENKWVGISYFSFHLFGYFFFNLAAFCIV